MLDDKITNITPSNNGYVKNYTVLVSTVPVNTKLKVASFQVTKSGVYLWSPRFRSTLTYAEYMAAKIDNANTPTYSLGSYNDSVTMTGAGNNITECMSGMAVVALTANTTYYVWFETNRANSGVNTFNWYSLMYLRP